MIDTDVKHISAIVSDRSGGPETPTLLQAFVNSQYFGLRCQARGGGIGLTSDGLPVGLELDGLDNSDRDLIKFAMAMERAGVVSGANQVPR